MINGDCHMNCERKTKNMENCNCSYDPCPRKGICCECLTYHRNKNELPACYFDAAGEATWDRSITNFVKRNS